jgi:hypothetical protein
MQATEQNLPKTLPTKRAAEYLNRSEQTLRKWACKDCAPMGVRPIRINRRLAWRIEDLLKILGA